jgi:hypothetical protein
MPFGDASKPLNTIIKGTVVQLDDMEMMLLDVAPLGGGWYKGVGKVSVDYLGGANFAVKFDRLFIDDNRVAGYGRVDYISKGIAEMLVQQSVNAAQKEKEKIQQQNRDAWAGTDFYNKIIAYDNIVVDAITAEGIGYLDITDSDGNVTTNAEVTQILLASPEKAIIIQDKNGDQFVVQKDGDKTKITKVPGGGLSPNNNVVVSDATIDLLKKALKELRKNYSDSKIKDLQQQRDGKESQFDKELTAQDARYNFDKATIPSVDPGENVFFETNEDESSDDTASPASQYKKLEMEVNKAQIIRLIAEDKKNEQAIKDMAAELTYNGQSIQEYIEQQRTNKTSDDEIVTAIKASIADFVETTLKKNLVFK